ncbi:MAG: peptidylprolyl isomerase [bacterium]|nr:peptidylprolyl isomerase [bacterium]
MSTWTKHRLVALAAASALGLSLAACSGGGKTLASVNGQKITKAQLDTKLEASPGGKQMLGQLIQTALLDDYAKQKGITASGPEIQKKIDEIKGRYPAGQFDALIKQQGLTMDDVKQIVTQQVLLEKAVAPQVHVSDADVKAFFEKNHAAYDKPEQARARHILVPDLKTAGVVEQKLKQGQKFEDLAKEYSIDPGSKDKGGELGWFGKGQMVPAFQNAAFSLPIGQISPPVKSPFGYHIIQVEERRPAQKATLASSAPLVKQQLTQQQESQLVPSFLGSLRNGAKIEIYDQRFADLLPPTPPPSAPPAASTPAPAPATQAPAKK